MSAAKHAITVAADTSGKLLVKAKGNPAQIVAYGAAAAVVFVGVGVGYGWNDWKGARGRVVMNNVSTGVNFTSVAGALRGIAAQDWPQPPRILIAGSLYLAGEVLAANGTLPD